MNHDNDSYLIAGVFVHIKTPVCVPGANELPLLESMLF